MSRLAIQTAADEITLTDVWCLEAADEAAALAYPRRIHLDAKSSVPREVSVCGRFFGVGILVDGDPRLLLSGNSGGSIDPRSALLLDNRLLVIVATHVVRLSLPDIEIEWASPVDFAPAFALHFGPDQSFIIVHGELTISRLSLEGDVVWSQGGRDAFTGGFQMNADHVSVRDFQGYIYRFDYATGGDL